MPAEIKLPEIGDWIDNDRAIELCLHFGFDELANRISNSAFGEFDPWKFDGASMIPDHIVAVMINVDADALICEALKNDLFYAYGELGNNEEKLAVDFTLGQGLLTIGASAKASRAAFIAVDTFGHVPLGFEWGFARV